MKSHTKSSLQGNTRRAVLALAAAPLLAGVTTSVFAQKTANWPDKLIKIVVPFPPGGPTDTASRIVGQKLSERLKQTVLIENKSGASGSIAAAQLKKSDPDGYTLMMLATPTLLAPHLYKNAGYDTAKDFSPVATVYDLPIVMVVNPTMMPEVTDLPKLIALAKAQPGKLNYTSSGVGSFGHLSMELLKQLGKFDMQHVAYRGGVPAITDVLGGQVPVMYADLVAALPHIQAGTLRAIAVGSPARVAVIPDVKTIAEQGFAAYEAVSWGGLLAPPGTPKEIVARLSDELGKILAEKDTQDKLRAAGALPQYQTSEELGKRLAQDYAKWGKVIRDNNITTN